MTKVRVKLPKDTRAKVDWSALRAELHIKEPFSPDALAEAHAATQHIPSGEFLDVPFFTLDPIDSMDLDQAMYLQRTAVGYRVLYAIADVAAFVKPGSALDVEAHSRVETFYCPDIRVPLHPAVLSEGAASLLPNEIRPALVWQLDLDKHGEFIGASVTRKSVMSRRKRDYGSVQAEVDSGTADEQVDLLCSIGKLRHGLAKRRGSVDLRIPEQMVTDGADGRPSLAYRVDFEIEAWNEQISLLTGIAAAKIMIDGGVGILRTLPPPDARALTSLRQSAVALKIDWPQNLPYGEFVSALDPHVPAQAAMLNLSAQLLRGAGYVWFEGSLPPHPSHNAVAAPYAHCTAPLRRLVDRYAGEICLALCAGQAIPQWVRDVMPLLPAEMANGDRRAHQLDSATVDLAEAVVMQPLMQKTFAAVVVAVDDKGSIVQLADPPVRARCSYEGATLGDSIRVRVVVADPAKRAVLFEAI